MKKIICPNCGSDDIYSVLQENNAYKVKFCDEDYDELDFNDKIDFGTYNDGYHCAECRHRFYRPIYEEIGVLNE